MYSTCYSNFLLKEPVNLQRKISYKQPEIQSSCAGLPSICVAPKFEYHVTMVEREIARDIVLKRTLVICRLLGGSRSHVLI